MLKLLRIQVAAFFALLVLVVLIVQSLLIMAIEFHSDILRLNAKMAEDAQRIVQTITTVDRFDFDVHTLSPFDQNNIRLYDTSGALQFVGLIFQSEDTLFNPRALTIQYGDRHYRVLTFPIFVDGTTIGFLQIGETVRTFSDRLLQNAMPLLLLSLILSSLKMIIGIIFLQKILEPVRRSMDNMEQFTQNAGHELRTPLANMQSSLDVALRSGDYEEGLHEVHADLQTMRLLIDRLLELEAIDESTLEHHPLNLSLLAEDIVHKFEPAFKEHGLNIVKDIKPDVIRLADAELIRTALTGLIQNACKFTEKGGTVTVVVHYTMIEIRDTGIGMAPEIANHIFDRFFKADTSRNNEGFGLGLALVKRILDLHGWQIFVISKPGKGTTFRIKFRKK